jgi:hypothetical protein
MVIHNAGQVFLKTLLGFVVHCPHPNLIISNSDVKPDTNLHLHGRDEMELQCSLSHGVGSCVLQAPVKSLFWGGGFKVSLNFLGTSAPIYPHLPSTLDLTSLQVCCCCSCPSILSVTFSIVCGNFSQKEKMCMEKEWNIEFLIRDLIAHSVYFVMETGRNNALHLFFFFSNSNLSMEIGIGKIT